MTRRWLLACSMFIGAACSASQGFHVDVLEDRLRQDAAAFEGPSPAAQDREAPPKHIPATMALYLKPTGYLGRGFEWSDADRDQLSAWGKDLTSKGLLAGTKFVSPASLKGHHLGEVRHAAERYGSDVVLVLDGSAEVDRFNNYKAPWLYWTIIGVYVADGTQSNALCLIQATMWDVKTGSRLWSDRAQGQATRLGPAALVDDQAVIAEAKVQALVEIERRLEARLLEWRGAR